MCGSGVACVNGALVLEEPVLVGCALHLSGARREGAAPEAGACTTSRTACTAARAPGERSVSGQLLAQVLCAPHTVGCSAVSSQARPVMVIPQLRREFLLSYSESFRRVCQ